MAACGTYAGYQAHRARSEDACADCRAASATYQRNRRIEGGRDYYRAYNKARARAVARLIDRQRGEFATLLADERAKRES